MKLNFAEEIRNIIEQSKSWLLLEVEYAKLSIAEKLTVIVTSLVLGFVCLLLGSVVLIILALAIAELFKLIMCAWLSYLATAGVICLLLVLLFLFKTQLLLTPLARLITKAFFEKKHSNS